MTDDQQRPTGFVYVDTETTGLDHRRHDAYELGWAVDEGPIHRILLPHRLRYADPVALEVGGYRSRGIAGRLKLEQSMQAPVHASLHDFVAAFTGPDGSQRTLVAANVTFDWAMLFGKVVAREPWSSRARRRLLLPAPPAPAEPWHYRKLDIEAYAAGAFGWDRPKGVTTIRDWLTARGYLIPAQDHTAVGDVATIRAIHYACWDYLGKPWAIDLCPKLTRGEPA